MKCVALKCMVIAATGEANFMSFSVPVFIRMVGAYARACVCVCVCVCV